MKTLLITGYGSDLHIKRREDEEYEESYYFLNFIDEVTIDGEDYDFENIEVDDVLTNFGFKHGESTIKWAVDEDDDEFFEFEFEYEVPDADDYEIKIKHIADAGHIGEMWLVDVVEVNGEEIMSENTPDYYGTTMEFDV